MNYYDITFSDVQIEEVTVKHSLYTASNNSNEVKEVLRVISVYPVENVECTVGAQGKQIVARDSLCLPCLTDHEQLWQDGYWLQVDRECPQYLCTQLFLLHTSYSWNLTYPNNVSSSVLTLLVLFVVSILISFFYFVLNIPVCVLIFIYVWHFIGFFYFLILLVGLVLLT